MSKLILTLKESPRVPLEAESISPDVIAPLTPDAVAALPVWLGKRQLKLEDAFAIEGEPCEEIEVRGDAARVKWIGRGMTRGRITVTGNAGMHVGAYMKGGEIHVAGNVSDWAGGEMTGGLIRIDGNAGGQIGAAYRGSMAGMNGGTILIGGSATMEIGMRMKRGTIVVNGPARDFAGLQMKGGTIFLLGGAELRTGAWMVRGTIVSLTPLRLLPTFAQACDYQPSFLGLYARSLARWGFRIPYRESEGCYRRFVGDSAVPGKGEILVHQPPG